ncbi:MAG: TrkA family potassium uptake protein [Desulfobulbaceae bacterium]|nr:TrkA family potassium uptake protein [Candidatus Kapabacteria bacterium]MBS4000174.1 TrkA family potassium uptake protein [Desulfobulbaceae bacterium]
MATNNRFCVIGLGYFGLNLALNLADDGAEVLAIDISEERVDLMQDRVSLAVTMDSTDIKAIKSLGIKDMDAVIVAIGEGFEASINTTAILQELGCKRIIVRAISPVHERLLRLMNIQELLVPEAEAAEHLASRLMMPGLLESYEINRDYSIFEIKVPKRFIAQTLLSINLRTTYNINLVTVKRIVKSRGLLTKGEKEVVDVIGVPSPTYLFHPEDILVLFGKEADFMKILELDQ